MALRINQNIAALNSYRNLNVSDSQMAKSLEKLSSGFRINRAADDAAGLVISEGLRAQVGGLKVAVRNAQDGISVVQTAEGALNEVHSILQRMRDLAVQAANGGTQDTESLKAANAEVTALKEEIDRIGAQTKFGGKALLDGTFGKVASATSTVDATGGPVTIGAGSTFKVSFDGGTTDFETASVAGTYASAEELELALQTAVSAAVGVNHSVQVSVTDGDGDDYWSVRFTSDEAMTFEAGTTTDALDDIGITAQTYSVNGSGGVFHVGANKDENIDVSIGAVSSSGLLISSANLQTDANAAIKLFDDAVKTVSGMRGDLGAVQNRFEHAIASLNVSVENISASESRIRDADMAQEMVQYTRNQILTQAGTAMLAQANAAPQGVLQLLRG